MHPYQIYRQHLGNGQVDIEGAVAAGMIRKADLIDGAEYAGYCRNADRATWLADKQRFGYVRHKFNFAVSEYLPHPEDDVGFDVFVPVSRLDSPR